MANLNSIPLYERKRSQSFLSRLTDKNVNELREKTRQSTNISGTIYFLKQGVREYQSKPCIMTNLSSGGAFLETENNNLTRQYVYLLLDDVPYKFKGILVGYSKNGYHLEFAPQLPAKAVEMIVSSTK